MFGVAIKMLLEDKTKYIGLLIGIAFTAFLVTFAMAYFAGFMTRGFALVSENPTADIWVMDKAVHSTQATINMSDSALYRVKSVAGVSSAMPLYIQDMTARFANGHFQSFQVMGVDDATLSGAPRPTNGLKLSEALHIPSSVIVDSGGTEGKLQTPKNKQDMWPYDGVHLHVPTRELRFGDTLLINSKRVFVSGVSKTIPRFPPRPLLYTSISNFKRLSPSQNRRLTFVMVKINKGASAKQVAKKIETQTGLKALTSAAFKKETVLWYLQNSEDVGDMVNMVVLAMLVGFGVTGVMLYMFTQDHFKQYAILKALGTTSKQLQRMLFTQIFVSAFVGSGIGVGICTLFGLFMPSIGFPYRLMWFAPLLGIIGVFIVSCVAGFISTRALKKLQPAIVFAT